jgi:hypothetical protein
VTLGSCDPFGLALSASATGSGASGPLHFEPVIDFAPVKDRLQWAERHGRRVAEMADEYVKQRPFVVTEAHEGGHHTYTAEIVTPPPVEIALTLSDTLHELRATLDNLVGVLRTGGPSDRSEFIIDTDSDRYGKREGDRLEGLPPWALDELRAVQPFPDNLGRWVGGRLQQLDALANRDRHRALFVQSGVIEWGEAAVHHAGTGEPQFRVPASRLSMTLDVPDDAVVVPRFEADLILAEPDLIKGWPVRDVPDWLSIGVREVVARCEERAGREASN